jgi:threonine/homoserine/homoserine lactone efflux protein
VDAFLVGIVAGYGIAIPVGAIAILIVQVGIRCGFWCAASAGAGAASADLVYSLLAVTGGAALAASVGDIGEPLRIVSALVLVVIAVLGLLRSRRELAPGDEVLPGRREYATTYVRFLGLTIINPMTIVYFAAVVVGLNLGQGLRGPQVGLFAAGAFLASLSWQLLLAGVGAFARRRLPRRAITAAVVGGNLVIFGMAGWILLG